jgi:hypothetical protein
MIQVEDIGDNTLHISWDENDPMESLLNEWSEEDFIEIIRKYCLEANEKNN